MKFIIVGCGRMGTGLSHALHKRGHDITLIDKDPAAIERQEIYYRKRSISGSGFDRDILLRAGIESADGLAAATSSDEVNIVLARLSRLIFHVPKVVARLVGRHQAEDRQHG